MKATTQSTSISTREYEGNELIVDYGSESSRANGHEEETDSSLPKGGKKRVLAEARRQDKPTNLSSILSRDELQVDAVVEPVASEFPLFIACN